MKQYSSVKKEATVKRAALTRGSAEHKKETEGQDCSHCVSAVYFPTDQALPGPRGLHFTSSKPNIFSLMS